MKLQHLAENRSRNLAFQENVIPTMMKTSYEDTGLARRRTAYRVNELQLSGHLHPSLKSPILTEFGHFRGFLTVNCGIDLPML
jgi:hypothetical protein